MVGTGKWEGVYPAVTTKFTADGRLDAKEMERCFNSQIDAGVDGLIVCGSLGEASTLEPDEKLEVLKIARGVAGKLPVILTVCDGSTRNAQAMAERGAKAGAAGFMVLPGLPYKSDPRETIAHFTAVARAGGLPVMIYNNPPAYGVDITPDMLVEMASEPLFTSIKESSDNVRRITEIINLTGDRYQVFTGVRPAGWPVSSSLSPPRPSRSGSWRGPVAWLKHSPSIAGSGRCSMSTSPPSWCRTSSLSRRW